MAENKSDGMSRRDFVKAAAVLGGAALLGTETGCSQGKTSDVPTEFADTKSSFEWPADKDKRIEKSTGTTVSGEEYITNNLKPELEKQARASADVFCKDLTSRVRADLVSEGYSGDALESALSAYLLAYMSEISMVTETSYTLPEGTNSFSTVIDIGVGKPEENKLF
jgi:hypothetical protein